MGKKINKSKILERMEFFTIGLIFGLGIMGIVAIILEK